MCYVSRAPTIISRFHSYTPPRVTLILTYSNKHSRLHAHSEGKQIYTYSAPCGLNFHLQGCINDVSSDAVFRDVMVFVCGDVIFSTSMVM